MGYAPIQTMPFVAAQPLLYVRIINHSIRTTPFCVGLHHRFYHQAATPDAYGQLLHNALLFGHSKGDLNPIPPAYASVLSTYTILLRRDESPYELSLCSPILFVFWLHQPMFRIGGIGNRHRWSESNRHTPSQPAHARF